MLRGFYKHSNKLFTVDYQLQPLIFELFWIKSKNKIPAKNREIATGGKWCFCACAWSLSSPVECCLCFNLYSSNKVNQIKKYNFEWKLHLFGRKFIKRRASGWSEIWSVFISSSSNSRKFRFLNKIFGESNNAKDCLGLGERSTRAMP